MKTITKIFKTALAAVAIFTTTNLKAKTTTPRMESGMGFKVGMGVNVGVFLAQSPLSYSYFASFQFHFDLTQDFAITSSLFYTKLMGRNNALDVDFIPAKGGVKVFAIKRMYLATEAGAGFSTQDGAKTNFIYTGGLGYEWNNGLDIGVRYEGYVNDSGSTTYFKQTGQYALRLAYNFKL